MLHARKLIGVEQVLYVARLENNTKSNSDIESEPVWPWILSEIENARLEKNIVRFWIRVFRKWQSELKLSRRP